MQKLDYFHIFPFWRFQVYWSGLVEAKIGSKKGGQNIAEMGVKRGIKTEVKMGVTIGVQIGVKGNPN